VSDEREQYVRKSTDQLHETVLKVREVNMTKEGMEHVIGVLLGYMTDLGSPEGVDLLKRIIRKLNTPGGIEEFLQLMKGIDLDMYGEPDE
jgi:hypothetical protein